MASEIELIEDSAQRAQYISRADELDRIKPLVLAGDRAEATLAEVAEFWEVPINTMRVADQRHKSELEGYGRHISAGQEVKTQSESKPLGGRPPVVYPRPAIACMGMILADAPLARTWRRYLLTAEAHVRHHELGLRELPAPAAPRLGRRRLLGWQKELIENGDWTHLEYDGFVMDRLPAKADPWATAASAALPLSEVPTDILNGTRTWSDPWSGDEQSPVKLGYSGKGYTSLWAPEGTYREGEVVYGQLPNDDPRRYRVIAVVHYESPHRRDDDGAFLVWVRFTLQIEDAAHGEMMCK